LRFHLAGTGRILLGLSGREVVIDMTRSRGESFGRVFEII
jgi:hypothetical protein